MDASQSNLIKYLSAYVNTYIEPCGWKAIWRSKLVDSSDFVCDFLVEVKDVTHGILEATVDVLSVIYPSIDGPELAEKDEERTKVWELLGQNNVKVPLSELYVVNETDDGEEFSVTAQVVEHVRFFLKHLWRPWDDVIESNSCNLPFAQNHLPRRIRFHFDKLNGQVSPVVVERVHFLINESKAIRSEFDRLDRKVNQPIEAGDSEVNEEKYADDTDLYEYLRLKMKLEDYALEMQRLEDPNLRLVILLDRLAAKENQDK